MGEATAATLRRRHRRGVRVVLLYLRALLYEFRWTLLALAAAILLGAAVIRFTPPDRLDNKPPTVGTALYGAWMAMLAQPIVSQPPAAGHLMVLFAAYPVLGFILIGEGVVRLALLMVSRREGRKEWMRVVASTYRDHVILCGLGHLGIRVLEQFVRADVQVVVLERQRANRFLVQAREMDVPILVRDMKEDQALIDAGVERASAIVICTSDDIGNLEVALDARRLNPRIRVLMRLFEEQLAGKIADAMDVDVAFSSSSLTAPLVAAMAMRARVLSSTLIGGVSHVVSEMTVEPGGRLAGKRVDEVESGYAGRVLAVTSGDGATPTMPAGATVLKAGDTIVFHTASANLAAVAAAARADEVG